MIKSFDPVYTSHSKVLVLGTMPGVQSLMREEYYGHPQNSFWRILFALWKEEAVADYAEKLQFLRMHGIALWDVLASCEREGSLDTAIKNPVPNDIGSLLDKCPGIDRIFFNGAFAAKLFGRFIPAGLLRPLQTTILPSTSPARAMPFAEKLAAWQALRQDAGS